VARTRNVAVVLDDLQWCDAASLALLRHLSRDVHDFGLLVVAVYRDLEIGRRHPLAAALPELSRERGARRLEVKGFGVDDVGRYLLAACGSVERGLVSSVHEQTGGNPLFVAELARLLQDEGELRQGALPQGVREVIGRRLDVLSGECKRVLEVASVLGRDFELELLCETARLPVPRVLEIIDEAVGAAFANPLRHQPGRYGFVHDLVRETLYQELPTPIRVQLHQGAAESLERRPGGGELAAPGPPLVPGGAGRRLGQGGLLCGAGRGAGDGQAGVRGGGSPIPDGTGQSLWPTGGGAPPLPAADRPG